jgi:hypothetical protein
MERRMFEAFPKLTRFSHDWTVTEKIDGSNAQILIVPANEVAAGQVPEDQKLAYVANSDVVVLAGSRNRLLSPGKDKDHFGFAGFVRDNAEEIVEKLGEGRHFGEWYGQGIGPRGYGVNPKRFALFNAGRWTGQPLPDRFDVVPRLYSGRVENFSLFDDLLNDLKQNGSKIAPGFNNPEGIVMYHGPSKTSFKRTFDYDEAGKWAENQARKNG